MCDKTNHDTAVSVTEDDRSRSSPSKMTGSAIGTKIWAGESQFRHRHARPKESLPRKTAAAIIPDTCPTVRSSSSTMVTVYEIHCLADQQGEGIRVAGASLFGLSSCSYVALGGACVRVSEDLQGPHRSMELDKPY